MNHIAIAAGRSGGHIIPGITIAEQLSKKHPNTAITFFATNNALDKKILAQQHHIERILFLTVDNVPKQSYRYPLFLMQLLWACIKTLFHLMRYRPKKIILMGGYISIPVCIAAWLLHIPRELYELNAIPGKATRFLSPMVNTICCCFSQTTHYFTKNKAFIVPYPVRFSPAVHAITQSKAIAELGLNPTRKTIVVLGGSQGSISLNQFIKKALTKISALKDTIQVIHQTGAHDKTNWQQWYKKLQIPALIFTYHHDLSLHYQAADLIIARSGAGTIFETLFFKKPCILIPLEHCANDHQLYNAQAMQQSYPQLFYVVQQSDKKISQKLATIIGKHCSIPTSQTVYETTA